MAPCAIRRPKRTRPSSCAMPLLCGSVCAATRCVTVSLTDGSVTVLVEKLKILLDKSFALAGGRSRASGLYGLLFRSVGKLSR